MSKPPARATGPSPTTAVESKTDGPGSSAKKSVSKEGSGDKNGEAGDDVAATSPHAESDPDAHMESPVPFTPYFAEKVFLPPRRREASIKWGGYSTGVVLDSKPTINLAEEGLDYAGRGKLPRLDAGPDEENFHRAMNRIFADTPYVFAKVLQEDSNIDQYYKKIGRLEQGATFEVYEVLDLNDPIKRLSMKTHARNVAGSNDLFQTLYGEVLILNRILPKHENILDTKDVLISPNYVHIVTQMCVKGVDLRGFFPVADGRSGRRVFQQIAETIRFMHQYGVLHMELLPQNVMFADPDFMKVKITGFGDSGYNPDFAQRRHNAFEPENWFNTQELDKMREEPKYDLKCLGSLLLGILAGRSTVGNENDIMHAYQSRAHMFPQAAHDLLRQIGPDPYRARDSKMPSIEKVCQNPWVSTGEVQTNSPRKDIPLQVSPQSSPRREASQLQSPEIASIKPSPPKEEEDTRSQSSGEVAGSVQQSTASPREPRDSPYQSPDGEAGENQPSSQRKQESSVPFPWVPLLWVLSVGGKVAPRILELDFELANYYETLQSLQTRPEPTVFEVMLPNDPKIRRSMRLIPRGDFRGIDSATEPAKIPFNVYKELIILRKILPEHDNIVEMKDVFVSREKIYWISELEKEKRTLLEWLPFAVAKKSQFRQIFKQIAETVRWFHQYGVVHMDLHPRHIVFSHQITFDTCQAVILDFSNAAYVSELATKRTPIFEDEIWFSPEALVMAAQGGNFDIDIRALGRILHAIMTGVWESDPAKIANHQPQKASFDKAAIDLLSKIGPHPFGPGAGNPRLLSMDEICRHPWLDDIALNPAIKPRRGFQRCRFSVRHRKMNGAEKSCLNTQVFLIVHEEHYRDQ